jgi:hypothetical protein
MACRVPEIRPAPTCRCRRYKTTGTAGRQTPFCSSDMPGAHLRQRTPVWARPGRGLVKPAQPFLHRWRCAEICGCNLDTSASTWACLRTTPEYAVLMRRARKGRLRPNPFAAGKAVAHSCGYHHPLRAKSISSLTFVPFSSRVVTLSRSLRSSASVWLRAGR